MRQNAAQKNSGMGSPIVVESALTRPMYARILLLLAIRSWGFVLLAGVAIFLAWTAVTRGEYTLFVIYVCALIAIYGGAVLVSVLAKKNRPAYTPVKYTFTEAGIVKQTAKAKQTVNWTAIVRWRKVGAYYLIYMSRRSFFVIPESLVPQGRAAAFRSLLSQKIMRKRYRVAH
jgi:YcxB-like protein